MADINQVKSQIRFQLDQLSARNAYHDFENLCRHLARARICSNIIPATGPVSAGGDQGRDFETFITYLRSTSIANSTFVGLISQRPIAFPCSLQKEDILSKIKSDINTIMASGSPIESVHYFCVSDIPIAHRHNLQSWAKDTYSIKLEIYDGQAISEFLTDREIFWIAVQYLEIPSEIYPRIDVGESWYDRSRELWKVRDRTHLNYADFYDIKAATRHATATSSLRNDLPFWIELLRMFTTHVLSQLKRKAVYEIAVASLRGLGTMIGQENDIREYFGKIPELESSVDLEDASCLLNYCIGATSENQVQLTVEELSVWRSQLLRKTEEKLEAADKPSLKCPLLEIRGYLSLSIDLQQRKLPDVDDAIKWWMQLTLLLKDAPLFPLERFADRLTGFIYLIGEHPQYGLLTQRVDLLLQERSGTFIVAEKCRDRAIEFYNKGKLLRAVSELHNAKIKWFAEESLHGSLLSMLLISRGYLELGLSFAAKYYALAVAFVALYSSKPEVKSFISRGLIAAAECDYHQGCWCGFLEFTDIGLKYHNLFSKQQISEEDEIQRTLFHISMLSYITRRLDSQLSKFVEERIHKWNMNDWLKDLLPMAHSVWDELDTSELWTRVEEQMAGRPFGDVGTEREVMWSELGIIWRINWKNDYDTTLAAEQLIAILQILLADLADVDLCLMKTVVNVSICINDRTPTKIDRLPSNIDSRWKVSVPRYSEQDDKSSFERLQIELLGIATTMIAEISLLPNKDFSGILENCFRNGISMKVFVAKPYEILYGEFIPQNVYESSDRLTKSIPELPRQFNIREHRELAWVDRLGPGYSKGLAEKYLQNRYSSLSFYKYTLLRLSKSPEFKWIVAQLRSEGWLDWHILNAVSNIATNYRVMQFPEARYSRDVYDSLLREMMNRPESEYMSPIPLNEFSLENLKNTMNAIMISSLKIFGLECHQETPNFNAISHFLGHRYNYWKDDIEHTDPFE